MRCYGSSFIAFTCLAPILQPVSGVIVEHLGLVRTGWIGAPVVLGAFGLTALSGRLDRLNPIPVRVGEKAIHAAGY